MLEKALDFLFKDSPQITAAGLLVAGVPLEHWVIIMTAAWAAVRLVISLIDLYRKVTKK